MKVKELIAQLEKIDGESRVFMGYDGNIVVTKPSYVQHIQHQYDIGNCWWGVIPGDTVILCEK